MTTNHQNDPFFDTMTAKAMDDFEEQAQAYFDRLDPSDLWQEEQEFLAQDPQE